MKTPAKSRNPAAGHDPLGLLGFQEFGKVTSQSTCRCQAFEGGQIETPVFANEFWTSKQRAAHSLHEISYRACFKPQLPGFFIERLSQPGEIIFEPMMGRGTTVLEAALKGRVPWGNDLNPLSVALVKPRLNPPTAEQVRERLGIINFSRADQVLPEELLAFYHPATLSQICSLRGYLAERREEQTLAAVDEWIQMVAINRLTGHSPGFFSVYTMPPNQAVTAERQRLFNEKRKQTPPYREVRPLILKKTLTLLRDCDSITRRALATVAPLAILLTQPAARTPQIPDASVSLVVTSPPFLDVVDYPTDNWLRCWFLGIDPKSVGQTSSKKIADWQAAMTDILRELRRVLKPGGHLAFEVGEVRKGTVKLEEAAIPCGLAAGLKPMLVLINQQGFTKTANCWGVTNNCKGTNTNRVVLFQKPAL